MDGVALFVSRGTVDLFDGREWSTRDFRAGANDAGLLPRLIPEPDGKGAIAINGRTLDHYFSEEKDRASVMGPLTATDLANRIDVIVKAHGGHIGMEPNPGGGSIFWFTVPLG